MSDESRLPKVGENLKSSTDAYFKRKAEAMSLTRGTKVVVTRSKNRLVGLGLCTAVFAISDGYTMFSVRQGKLLEDFDKRVE